MQKKMYFGGLPWEIDRIGLLNYVKAILEENDLEASYELPFITSPLINPNSILKVTDVFVALDRKTKKSRGFGFVTIEILSDNVDEMFENIIEMLNGKVMIGIRGPRELIVNEADPRPEDREKNNRKENNSDSDDSKDDEDEDDEESTMGLDW